MKLFAFGLAALALAACSPATTTQAPADAPPPAAAASQPRLAPHGAYDAISNTAMSITGGLTLLADTLRFEKGQSYTTEHAVVLPSSAPYARGGEAWTALLSVPADSNVEIRRITAAQGASLCGADAATFLALAEGADGALKLAAFKSDATPGPEGDPANLCGTFYYALTAAAPVSATEDPSQAAH